MASLKEIKNRIASVSSTLKITSAMKMVASAKLRKTQRAMGNLGPYQALLSGILYGLLTSDESDRLDLHAYTQAREVHKVALVCFASNSSLCGAFNTNAVREALSVLREYTEAGVAVTVYSVGRKMADAMRRAGYPSPADYTALSARPGYEQAAALGEELVQGYLEGRFDRVEFIYNHARSASSQQVVRETYLPFAAPGAGQEESTLSYRLFPPDYIVEPGRAELVEELLPKVLRLKMYTVLLDTVTAEHGARVVAMQTATDNANSLLVTLTLEYNKSRQQKITAEILDIVGGSLA